MPPRQRPGANLDDSRPEASSGHRDRQGTAAKGRRTTANAPTAGNTAAGKDAKNPAKPPAASEAVGPSQSQDGRTHINWSSMPLSVLHDYRHAYNLPCPSAYSSQINSILLSQGIGLRSPTSLAARPAKTSSSSSSKPAHAQPNATSNPTDTASNKQTATTTTIGTATDTAAATTGEPIAPPPPSSAPQPRSSQTNLRRVQGQDRVTKDHLAAAVRKHFNNVAISEQDAVARFLYKVREERKGRAFRLRFQP